MRETQRTRATVEAVAADIKDFRKSVADGQRQLMIVLVSAILATAGGVIIHLVSP